MIVRLKGLRFLRSLLRRVWHGTVDAGVALARCFSPRSPRIGPPPATFSAYRRLLEGTVTGRVVLPSQDIGPISPDALRITSGLNQHKHQPWPIFWTRHKNARLVGETLVLMDETKKVCLEAMYVEHHSQDPAFRSMILPRPVRLEGSWTSVISRWTSGPSYYHWLMDGLPRLASLPDWPSEVKVLVPAGLSAFQRDTLRWLGLEGRYRETAETHLLLDEYFFSSPTAMTGCTNPYAVAFLREKFLPHAEAYPGKPGKIYITRRHKTRGILNEEEVKHFFSQRGWLVVDGEALSLSQQIGLFSEATEICGAHGAGFTNIVWCPPHCRVLELMADTFQNGCYESIAACLGLSHRHLLFRGDAGSRIHVDLQVLEHALEEN